MAADFEQSTTYSSYGYTKSIVYGDIAVAIRFRATIDLAVSQYTILQCNSYISVSDKRCILHVCDADTLHLINSFFQILVGADVLDSQCRV